MPILLYLKLAGAAAVAVGLLWLVDEIGDRREAKVRTEMAQATAALNAELRDVAFQAIETERRHQEALAAAVKVALAAFAKGKNRCIVDETKAAIYARLVRQ